MIWHKIHLMEGENKMDQLSLSEKYAIIAMDGLTSTHPSMAKSAALRSIVVAKGLEEIIDMPETHLEEFTAKFMEMLKSAQKLNKKIEKQVEDEIINLLENKGMICKVPDLLECDMNYYTSGLQLKAYRSQENIYCKIIEDLRTEILDTGTISIEYAVLLWLLRESGCIHVCFSAAEQNYVQSRMIQLSAKNTIYQIIWKTEFHSVLGELSIRFLRVKQNLFSNPYLEGVNLVFPFLQRRNAIFIDFVILGTNVKERRAETIRFIRERGHKVEEVKLENETLLKIDNAYYRIFPYTKRVYKLPVQGINLVPVYW